MLRINLRIERDYESGLHDMLAALPPRLRAEVVRKLLAQAWLMGRLRLSNTPAGDWMEGLIDQIIEDRENGLPVPNVGLSADMMTGYYVDGETKVATEVRSVYSVDAVFYPASGGSFDRVLNSMAGGQKAEGGGGPS